MLSIPSSSGGLPKPASDNVSNSALARPERPAQQASLLHRKVSPVPGVPAIPSELEVPSEIAVSSKTTRRLGTAFFDDCQTLFRRYMHNPLPGSDIHCGQIPRLAHGAQHLGRTACWVPVLLAFRQQAGDREALDFPMEHLPCLLKAAILHDAGRCHEGADDAASERRSGEICEDHLLATGCPPRLAAELREAIVNKNQKETSGKERQSLLEKLLHDADCLDIMRCRPEFDISYLDVFHDFKNNQSVFSQIILLTTHVRAVIQEQSDLLYDTAIILSRHNRPAEQIAPAIPARRDLSDKYCHEFSCNALLHQITWLKHTSPYLYDLYKQGVAEVPEISLNLLSAQYQTDDPLYPVLPRYNDPATGNSWLVCADLPIPAGTHRLLINKLINDMGIQTPGCRLCFHNLAQCSLYTEKVDNDVGQTPEKMDKPSRARLFIVASVLGLWEIADTARVVKNQLVISDVSVAGLFSGLSRKSKQHFLSTPFEVEWFRNPDKERDAFPSCSDEALESIRKARSLFCDLEDEDLCSAVEDFSHLTLSFSNLVERWGPDKAIDRHRLLIHLTSRAAYFRRRFPPSVTETSEPLFTVTSLEQYAVEATRVQGFCLPVSHKDIVNGELRLFHTYDPDNKPVAAAWLKLTPSATRRLADALGIAAPWHRRFQILDYYVNHVFKPENRAAGMRGMVMDTGWRRRLSALKLDCWQWLGELSRDVNRFPGRERDIESIISTLNSVHGYLQHLYSLPDGSPLIVPEVIEIPADIPGGLPSRVTTFKSDEPCPGYHFRVCRHRMGYAWETGAINDISPSGQTATEKPSVHYFHIPGQRRLKGKEAEINATLFADDLPDGFSFTGCMHLRQSGTGVEISQSLVNYLDMLGINVSHTGTRQLQQHYIESVENCTAGTIQFQDQPLWFDHCRIINGKPCFYRPLTEGDKRLESSGLSFLHVLNNTNARRRKILELSEAAIKTSLTAGETARIIHQTTDLLQQMLRRSRTVFNQMIQSGCSIDPYVHRIRKGIQPDISPWSHLEVKEGGASCTFFGSTLELKKFNDTSFLQIASLACRRTDAVWYKTCHAGNAKPEFQHYNRLLPGQLEGFSPLRTDNEFCLDTLSLEESSLIHVPGSSRAELFHFIGQQMSCWFDGSLPKFQTI